MISALHTRENESHSFIHFSKVSAVIRRYKAPRSNVSTHSHKAERCGHTKIDKSHLLRQASAPRFRVCSRLLFAVRYLFGECACVMELGSSQEGFKGKLLHRRVMIRWAVLKFGVQRSVLGVLAWCWCLLYKYRTRGWDSLHSLLPKMDN
jgi:hypothetical protein